MHRLSTSLPHYCQDAALCSTPKGVVVAVVVVVVATAVVVMMVVVVVWVVVCWGGDE